MLGCAPELGNGIAFAQMIDSALAGRGAMPAWLGIEAAAFQCLVDLHFPGEADWLMAAWSAADPGQAPARADERDELVRLLLRHRAGDCPSEVWMASILAAGCMGSDHLWQDLGLRERGELSALMYRNFPSLASRNLKDMKWKRFLYKQLCEAEGIYTCRAPSCEVCVDYDVCFGPER